MRISIIISLFILLTSCATTNYYEQTINSWHGKPLNELIASWGEPNQVIKVADGTETVIYVTHKPFYSDNMEYQTQVFVVGNKNIGVLVPRNQPKTMMTSCMTLFYLNNKKRIISTHFEGGRCYGEKYTSSVKNTNNP